jgi:hypothetical protein
MEVIPEKASQRDYADAALAAIRTTSSPNVAAW